MLQEAFWEAAKWVTSNPIPTLEVIGGMLAYGYFIKLVKDDINPSKKSKGESQTSLGISFH